MRYGMAYGANQSKKKKSDDDFTTESSIPGLEPVGIGKKSSSKNDDQKRTLTPKEAINLGADFLVIGRPIIESKNPLETIKKINHSIQ